uniref:Reverse transcriptase domain-containing protein n=1 Tax=Leptobrachium leishanense TaxID=445787 RepID=A0A8C5QSH7_9ANUR
MVLSTTILKISFLWCPNTLFNALYDTPSATITTNGFNSTPFTLERGTRQGCPLSPLLFNLALEPLLRIFQTCPDFRGIQMGSQEVRIVAFADDLLLFLSRPDKALPTLLTYLEEFHLASGFKINYDKTLAIPLGTDYESLIGQHNPFRWCRTGTFKYLGVLLPTNIARLYEVNIPPPLLSQLKNLLASWAKLPLSYLGRCSLIKMVTFPRLLYQIQMLPLLLKRQDIAHIHALFTRFIWSGGRPRIALHKLQLPYNMGGLNLPAMYSYNIALYRIVADWIADSSRYTDCALDRAMSFPLSPLAFLHSPCQRSSQPRDLIPCFSQDVRRGIELVNRGACPGNPRCYYYYYYSLFINHQHIPQRFTIGTV